MLGVISSFSIEKGSSAKAKPRTFSTTDNSSFTRSTALRIAARNSGSWCTVLQSSALPCALHQSSAHSVSGTISPTR